MVGRYEVRMWFRKGQTQGQGQGQGIIDTEAHDGSDGFLGTALFSRWVGEREDRARKRT